VMTLGVVVARDVRFNDHRNERPHDCGDDARFLFRGNLLFTNIQKMGSSDVICLKHVIHNKVELLSREGVLDCAKLFLENI
jgi:hypothetical protein